MTNSTRFLQNITRTSACLTAAIISIFFITTTSEAQIVLKDSANKVRMKASESYYKGKLYRFFWGDHYRADWHVPVLASKVNLDTLRGGVTAYQTGGGRQTKSVRVKDKDGREYVLRSVDKSFGKALPDIAQGTFVETLVDDQVTIAHPFAGLVAVEISKQAGTYYTDPVMFYVPKQKGLKEFSDSSGDKLYFFEKRPDENWETAANFGNSKKIVSTEKMLEKILEDNDNSVDQKMFARARLVDILIGDWGRHEDQWRWATFKDDKKTTYVPIPRDRDNAFTKFDGLMLKVLIPAARAKHLQTFDYKIKNVDRLNFPARHLDHHLLNELNREDWIAIAKDLQSRLTDNILEAAVRKMPADVYPVSGPDILAKLKSRRDLLAKYAEDYFKFLSEDVEITGSEKHEYFEIKRLSDQETEVNIYKIAKDGDVKKKPLYHRVFKNNETNEIRLYGISGNDSFHVSGNVRKSIKIRMIGGRETDTYVDESSVKGPSHKSKIYDNPGNNVTSNRETAVNISKDSSINAYDYKYFNYNNKGLVPQIFFNNDDRLYAGLGYISSKYKWRKYPLANVQYIDVKYSISQMGFSSTYYSNFTDLLGKWNVNNYLNYDDVRWTNFLGLGNDTKMNTNDNDFYWMRSKQFNASTGVSRVFKNKHKIIINAVYQNYKIIRDNDRFLAKQSVGVPVVPVNYNSFDFGGANFRYVFQTLNDSALPTKGISFGINAAYTNNLKKSSGDFGSYGAELTIFQPLTKKFGLMIRGGGATLSGTPEFFQYNRIGGSETFRGVRRDRYYGNSTAFSQNELRWITNVRSRLMNGKFGLFGLYDAGRVWLDGENSNTWHHAYGGGIMISPFNFVTFTAAYAKSEDDQNIHFRVIKLL